VARPLLSLNRRPHFKTCKILERTKILSWLPTEPEKNDCIDVDQQQFTGLDWNVTSQKAMTLKTNTIHYFMLKYLLSLLLQ
jgi:hypothetical protein